MLRQEERRQESRGKSRERGARPVSGAGLAAGVGAAQH